MTSNPAAPVPARVFYGSDDEMPSDVAKKAAVLSFAATTMATAIAKCPSVLAALDPMPRLPEPPAGIFDVDPGVDLSILARRGAPFHSES